MKERSWIRSEAPNDVKSSTRLIQRRSLKLCLRKQAIGMEITEKTFSICSMKLSTKFTVSKEKQSKFPMSDSIELEQLIQKTSRRSWRKMRVFSPLSAFLLKWKHGTVTKIAKKKLNERSFCWRLKKFSGTVYRRLIACSTTILINSYCSGLIHS